MEKLIDFITHNKAGYHPVELAAKAHHYFVAIHPFDDGNGRVARLVMNLIMMEAGYPPIVIKNETREDYYLALSKADKVNFEKMFRLFYKEIENSLKIILHIIDKR